MSRVAIFTDTASDLDPAEAAASGIGIVPLIVTFGTESFKAGVELSGPAFWERMTAPDAPFPTTAASSPGDFKEAYEAAFAAGAEAIVSVHVAATLSGTLKSAQIARDMLPDREIHLVDSQGASMAEGLLCRMGVEMAAQDRPAAEIAETLEARAQDLIIYLTLDTLAYLKKGGRISSTQAAIGSLLSVKPIIRVKDGLVETIDKVRTRGKARDRMIELVAERPDRAHVGAPHPDPRRRGVPRRGPGSGPRPRPGRRDDRARRRVGRPAPRPGLRRRGGAVSAVLTGRALVGRRLRQGCDRIADRYHRGGEKPGRPAILRPADESRVAGPASPPGPV